MDAPDSQTVVARNAHGRYCVPRGAAHRPAARAVLAGETWEPDTLSFVASVCRGGDIVHAGTFFGDFLPAYSRACGSTGRVWAFEPGEENHRCARETIKLNGLRNVELRKAALDARAGESRLVTARRRGQPLGGASYISEARPRRGDTAEVVEATTIDRTLGGNDKVTVIQLDVEGRELYALKGAVSVLQRCRPILVLERWEGVDFTADPWFSSTVMGLGYTAAATVHDNQVFVPV